MPDIFVILFAIGGVLVMAYCLFVSIKTGVAFGRWPWQQAARNESPIIYWFSILGYAFILACFVFILVNVTKGYFLGQPTHSN